MEEVTNEVILIIDNIYKRKQESLTTIILAFRFKIADKNINIVDNQEENFKF